MQPYEIYVHYLCHVAPERMATIFSFKADMSSVKNLTTTFQVLSASLQTLRR
jgi:hypothetical protein